MKAQQQYKEICQKALRKHYRRYRQRVNDPFFVDSDSKAEVAINKMLRDVRDEVEATVQINRRDMNSRRIAEQLLCDYLIMGRKYGERYYKKVLFDRAKSLNLKFRLICRCS